MKIKWWCFILFSLAFTYLPQMAKAQATNKLDNTGNVGIGTLTPAGILHTKSDDLGPVFQTSSLDNKRMQFFFRDNNEVQTARIGNDISGENKSQLQFMAGSGSSPQLTLDLSGNIGLGTTMPNIGGVNKAFTINAASGTNASYELAVNGSLLGSIYTGISTSAMNIRNQMNGPLTFGTNANEAMRINADGAVARYYVLAISKIIG